VTPMSDQLHRPMVDAISSLNRRFSKRHHPRLPAQRYPTRQAIPPSKIPSPRTGLDSCETLCTIARKNYLAQNPARRSQGNIAGSSGARELIERNRRAWNSYFAANLDAETRRKLVEQKRHSQEELTPFSPDELQSIEQDFTGRCKSSAKDLVLPSSGAAERCCARP
jgi:hypothetical protein